MRRPARYGWIPDLPDRRDRVMTALPRVLARLGAPLPPSVDLRANCPPVYDQGQLGSCTANAIAAALEYDEDRQRLREHGTPSRLFIYWNERDLEGTVESDAGAMIRDGIKSVAKLGAPPESLWPYEIERFRDRPPNSIYVIAEQHQALVYGRVFPFDVRRDMARVKQALAAGVPVIFGFTVYQSFESPEVARTGVVPMPGEDDEPIGGHAVLAVGYDDAIEQVIVRNSWGQAWGDGGYCTMPYELLRRRDLSADFWVVEKVEGDLA